MFFLIFFRLTHVFFKAVKTGSLAKKGGKMKGKKLLDHTTGVVNRITIALVVLLSVMLVWIGVRIASTGSPVKYVEKNTGLDLRNVVTNTEGTVEISFFEKYGVICMTLDEGGEEEIERQMESLGKVSMNEWTIPPCEGHELSKRAQEEDVIRAYVFYREDQVPFGKARRAMEVFLTTDKNGTAHLYCFG